MRLVTGSCPSAKPGDVSTGAEDGRPQGARPQDPPAEAGSSVSFSGSDDPEKTY
jgi:hypothetical protein